MKGTSIEKFTASFVGVLVYGVYLPRLAAEMPRPNSQATVVVYDYAQLSPPVLHSAQQEASRILHVAGIELIWANVPVLRTTQEERSPEHEPIRVRPILRMHILPPGMAARLNRSFREFGFAMGSDAYVFFYLVEELCRNTKVPHETSLVLGHVFAHEIGHLLLGPGAHSPSGLMRPRWQERDLVSAARGVLLFSAKQSRQMRATDTDFR
jgi:hypothetical protein